MDLPTYTNIWRIEKRLYKLYDFRLPMPLPVGQIAVFTAIAIPYVIVLTVLGLPFSHTSFWLYVLPPGVLAWLATRPVLESKRLPELIVSQLRYLGEPRTWCRLAPLAEKDEIVVVARVWRRDEPAPAELAARRKLGLAGRRALASPSPAAAASAGLAAPEPQTAVRVPEIPAWAVVAAQRSGIEPVRPAVIAPAVAAPAAAVPAAAAPAREPARWPDRGRGPAHPRVVPPAQERAPSHARHAAPPATALPPAASAWPAAAAVTPPTGLHAAALPPAALPPATPPPAASSRPAVPAARPANLPPAAPGRPAVPAARPANLPPAAPGRPAVAVPVAPALGALPPTASPLPPLPPVPGARMDPAARPLPAPPAAPPPPVTSVAAALPAAAPPAAGPPSATATASQPRAVAPAVPGPPAAAPAAAPREAAAAAPMPPVPAPPAVAPPAPAPPVAEPPVAEPPVAKPPVMGSPVVEPPASAPPAASPPAVTVTGDRPDGRPLRVVERALRGPADKRGDGWHDRVVVVPGGHRPGRPDFQQRDRARAQLPVAGSRRIVVLGCTVGAGQTMTTLMTGEVLAGVRDEPVAVLDLNSGRGSLAERAGSRPAVGQAPAGPEHLHHSPVPSRLAVISSDAAEAAGPPDDAGRDVARIFEMISARYSLTLADPAASAVPRVLAIADQLVLVAPASQDAARAIAMTLEWLEAHGYAGLAGSSATVINGVSRQTMTHVEQAEAVARGRCRAIVRVPWDDQLRNPGRDRRPAADPVAPLARPGGRLLGPAAVQAYTALAGVLVAGLATAPELRRAQL